MPDICMCHGEDCPLKAKCYRYRVKPDQWQSWFFDPPYKDGACEYFAPIRPSNGDLRSEKEVDKRTVRRKTTRKISPTSKARAAKKSSSAKAR